jgi:hypothetical protein
LKEKRYGPVSPLARGLIRYGRFGRPRDAVSADSCSAPQQRVILIRRFLRWFLRRRLDIIRWLLRRREPDVTPADAVLPHRFPASLIHILIVGFEPLGWFSLTRGRVQWRR